jgi:thymidylate synthase
MNNPHDKEYHAYLQTILEEGVRKEDRTGTGTISAFGLRMSFDLQKGFPLLTTKRVHTKSIIHELLWFLSGDINIRPLLEAGVSIWTDWAFQKWYESEPRTVELREDGRWLVESTAYQTRKKQFEQDLLSGKLDDDWGDLGPVYGMQWRYWALPHRRPDFTCHVDQIQWAVDRLKTSPDCRRIIVSAWNVGELEEMALAPCHLLFQFWTRELSVFERLNWVWRHIGDTSSLYALLGHPGPLADPRYEESNHKLFDRAGAPRRALSCQLYQRSCDSFLGVPFNIASYALLTHMVAQQVGMMPERLVWVGGDCHIYLNHLEQVKEQLSRESFYPPRLVIKHRPETIFDYRFEDFEIAEYESHPPIKAEISV